MKATILFCFFALFAVLSITDARSNLRLLEEETTVENAGTDRQLQYWYGTPDPNGCTYGLECTGEWNTPSWKCAMVQKCPPKP